MGQNGPPAPVLSRGVDGKAGWRCRSASLPAAAAGRRGEILPPAALRGVDLAGNAP